LTDLFKKAEAPDADCEEHYKILIRQYGTDKDYADISKTLSEDDITLNGGKDAKVGADDNLNIRTKTIPGSPTFKLIIYNSFGHVEKLFTPHKICSKKPEITYNPWNTPFEFEIIKGAKDVLKSKNIRPGSKVKDSFSSGCLEKWYIADDSEKPLSELEDDYKKVYSIKTRYEDDWKVPTEFVIEVD